MTQTAEKEKRKEVPKDSSKESSKRESVGQIIARRRKELGITQKQLSERIGSHVQMVVKLENGSMRFSKYLPLIEQELKLAPNTLSSIALDIVIKDRPAGGVPIYKLSHQ